MKNGGEGASFSLSIGEGDLLVSKNDGTIAQLLRAANPREARLADAHVRHDKKPKKGGAI